MGFFARSGSCPACFNPGAMISWFKTRCPTIGCVHYDPSLNSANVNPARSIPKKAQAKAKLNAPLVFSMTIEYRNFEEKTRTFEVDPATLKRVNRHISVCVAPSGKRISLNPERILNRAALAL